MLCILEIKAGCCRPFFYNQNIFSADTFLVSFQNIPNLPELFQSIVLDIWIRAGFLYKPPFQLISFDFIFRSLAAGKQFHRIAPILIFDQIIIVDLFWFIKIDYQIGKILW